MSLRKISQTSNVKNKRKSSKILEHVLIIVPCAKMNEIWSGVRKYGGSTWVGIQTKLVPELFTL